MLTANLEDRTISGLALPFGETGRTNLGRVIASAGSVTVPEDVSTITLNLEHSRTAPVGRATAVEETPEGLVATFRVARTRAGDDLLAEVEEGLRAGLSVELDAPVIRAGRLLSGALSAVAAVVSPAFPSALLTAADAGDVEDDEDETTDGETVPEAAPMLRPPTRRPPRTEPRPTRPTPRRSPPWARRSWRRRPPERAPCSQAR